MEDINNNTTSSPPINTTALNAMAGAVGNTGHGVQPVLADPVKVQEESRGIILDSYRGPFIECTFDEYSVARKDVRYTFRCSTDKICCGNQCCFPMAAGFPIWLLILILILAFLLALLLLGFLIYFCSTRYKRKTRDLEANGRSKRIHTVVTGTPPKVEIYQKPPPPVFLDPFAEENSKSLVIATNNHRPASKPTTEHEIKGVRLKKNGDIRPLNSNRSNVGLASTDHVTVLTDLEESGAESPAASDRQPSLADDRRIGGHTASSTLESARRGDSSRRLAYEPSPMEVSYERQPVPIPVSFHDRSEISVEQRPLLNRLPTPEQHTPRLVYYHSEGTRHDSFKEHAEYENGDDPADDDEDDDEQKRDDGRASGSATGVTGRR